MTFTVTVSPTRIKGDTRKFKDVTPAPTQGMAYSPSDYDLLTVHEKGVGFRNIALDAVVKDKGNKLATYIDQKGDLDELGELLDQDKFIQERKDFHRPLSQRVKLK